jgi:peroxiredoxin Q/BCP
MTRLAVGKKAPAFTLSNQDGEDVSLRDFAERRVVVYFYPADDTPGCTKEACQFNDLLASFKEMDVAVLGVSPDSADAHRAFRSKYGLTFPLLSDPQKKIMTKYGAYGEKMLYGKKVMGVIRSTFVIGPTGMIEHAFYGVRVDGHPAKVLTKLTN